MEQPPIPPPNTSLFQLNLDVQSSYTLRSAASWAKVLGVVGLIFGILFIVLALLSRNTSGSRLEYYDYRGGNNDSTYGMITFIVAGAFWIIGSVFALSFGNRITQALKTNDQNTLSSGFASVRNYFAFWAILLIIALLFILLGIVAAVSTSR